MERWAFVSTFLIDSITCDLAPDFPWGQRSLFLQRNTKHTQGNRCLQTRPSTIFVAISNLVSPVKLWLLHHSVQITCSLISIGPLMFGNSSVLLFSGIQKSALRWMKDNSSIQPVSSAESSCQIYSEGPTLSGESGHRARQSRTFNSLLDRPQVG